MTVGSFRMMPLPRAATSVFAVPRSIARSRGSSGRPSVRPPPAARRRRVWCERPEVGLELVDAVLHRLRAAIAKQDDRDPDDAADDRDEQESHSALRDGGGVAHGPDRVLLDGP